MTLREPNTETPAVLQLGHAPGNPDEPHSQPVLAPMSSKRRVLSALPDGLCFGKYQIVHLIAIGGMSEVYEAIHLGLHKHVALKVMRPDFAEDLEARQRFVAEGIHAARIRHTNVVDVCDVGVVDELPYLVMELLVGEDLGMVYDREKGLPIPELIDILLPVAFAVAEGHRKGVVHRDLKPENIFLHREGKRVIPKVLDFGVSRVISARRITLSASIFGTPHYMSPEQARGDYESTNERSDQYSLGVMLYEGATGRLPRDSNNALQLLHAVAYEPFTPPSSHTTLPDGLEALILRAMSHEPEQRFESMRELACALVPYGSESAREYWELDLGMGAGAPSGEALPPVATRYASWSTRVSRSGPSLISAAETQELAALRALDAGALGQLAAEPSRPAELLDVSALKRLAAGSSRPRQSTGAFGVNSALAATAADSDPEAKGRRWLWVTVGALAATASLTAAGMFAVRRWANEAQPARVAHATRQAEPANDTDFAARLRDGFEVDVQTTPGSAALELDGIPVAIGRYRARFSYDGTQHELRAHAAGFATESVVFRDTPPPAWLALTPLQLPAAASDESKPAAGRAAVTLTSAHARSLAARRKALTAALQAEANHSAGPATPAEIPSIQAPLRPSLP